VLEVGGGVSQPACLAGVSEQRLHHRQRDDLGVADLRRDPDLGPVGNPLRMALQQIVGTGIECGRKGVQVGVHANLLFSVG